jgi:hypothetical protein
MNFYEALVAQATPVSLEPSETSYFSTPGAGLDPRLFRSNKLIPAVRASILRVLFDHLKNHYYSPEAFTHVWLAGSGVSYQWTAARHPADLDCLIGINYLMFRQSNPEYKGLSDQEIASMFNENFRESLQPLTSNFLDTYELTFYVNPASDIRVIKPYAAYSVTNDDWTVAPEVKGQPVNKAWDKKVQSDTEMTTEIVNRYSRALAAVQVAPNDTARRNAIAALELAVSQGSSLFEDIHHGRTYAFSPSGQGYSDVHNYRWQAGKASGSVQALRSLSDIYKKSKKTFESTTYGMELPSSDTLVRRAALYRS